MREFLITFRFLLKNYFNRKYFLHRVQNDNHLRISFVIGAIALVTLIPTYLLMLVGINNFYQTISNISLGPDISIQQGALFIVFGVLVSLVITFVFGSYHIISHFYFSNDVRILLSKPIKTSHILLSKILVIYLYYVIMNAIFALPFFVIYGIHNPLFIYHWVFLILSFLLLPIIPLSLTTLLTVLIMRYTNFFKRKDLLRVVGMLLMIGVIIFIQLSINQIIVDIMSDAEQAERALRDNYYLVERIGKIYPVILFTLNAIRESFLLALGNVLLLFLISIVGIFVVMKVLEVLYLNSYFKEQIATTPKQKQKRQKGRLPIYRAIARIDYYTMLRVPVYLLNCIGVVILVPALLFGLPLIIEGKSFIQTLQVMHEALDYRFWLIVTIGITLMGTLTPIAVTTFSREGKTNWIMRTLPIPIKDHIIGRSYTPFFTNFLFSFIVVAALTAIVQKDFVYALTAFIQSTIAGIPFILLGILVDLYNPQLKWENPQRAVKQNLNVLVMMGIGFAYAILWLILYIVINNALSQLPVMGQYVIINLIFLVINIFLSFIIYYILSQQFERRLVVMPS